MAHPQPIMIYLEVWASHSYISTSCPKTAAPELSSFWSAASLVQPAAVVQALIQDSVLRVRKAHGNGHSEGHLPLTNDKELHLTPLSSGRGHESAGLIASRASQGDV